MPSLVYETFGYVVLEAFAEGTPVIVRDLGALPELVAESGGGLVFERPSGLVGSVDRLTRDPRLRDRLGASGLAAREGVWSEAQHLARYFDLIDRHRRARRVRVDRAHPSRPGPAPGSGGPAGEDGPFSGLGDRATRRISSLTPSANPARLNRATFARPVGDKSRAEAGAEARSSIARATRLGRWASRGTRRPRPPIPSGRCSAGSRPGSRSPGPPRRGARTPRNPTGKATRSRDASNPWSTLLVHMPGVDDPVTGSGQGRRRRPGPTKTRRCPGNRRRCAVEGVEDRRDVPPPRPLADEEEERVLAQPDRRLALADLGRVGREGPERRVRAG